MTKASTKREWMALYGTPDAPKPSETGWKGFSHPTRKQWAELWITNRPKCDPMGEAATHGEQVGGTDGR